jgi:hypothetical protein
MQFLIGALLFIMLFAGYNALTSNYNNYSAKSLDLKYRTVEYPTPPLQPPPAIHTEVKTEQPRPPSEPEIFQTQVIEIEEHESPDSFDNEADPANSIEQVIVNVFGNEWQIALAVAKAESSLNPQAVNQNRNGTRDIGIFQINDSHGWSENERFDWQQNIMMAKELRDRYGWTAWSVFNNGQYRQFL